MTGGSEKPGCSVEDCARQAHTRGYCRPHYRAAQRYGSPHGGPGRGRPRIDPLVRFHSYYKVDEATGCWVWQNHINNKGYGHFKIGHSEWQGAAYRFAYERLVGPVPEGMQLDHLCHSRDMACAGGVTCRHRACVNPGHLEVVTLRENVLRGVRHRGHRD